MNPPDPHRAGRNRANARHSTGPRTAEGKARSRWNAMTHGFYARTLATAGDAPAEEAEGFEALHEALLEEYAPEGLAEERLVARMAVLWWRQDRLFVHAQNGLKSSLDAGAGAVESLLGSEKVAIVEFRLERAISRLHRDLLFLARYRERARHGDARRRAAREVEDVLADLEAETKILLARAQAKRADEREMEEAESEAAAQLAPKQDRQAESGALPGEALPRAETPEAPPELRPHPPIGSKEWREFIGTKPSNGGSGFGVSSSR